MAEQRLRKGDSGFARFKKTMQENKRKFFYALTELLKRYTLGKDGFPFEIDWANNEDWIWFRWWYPGLTVQVQVPIFRKYRVPRHKMIVWFLIYVETETHGLPEQGHDRLFCSLNEADMGQLIQDQPRRGPVIPGSNALDADRNVIRAQYSALTPEAQQFTDFINNFYNTLRIPKEAEILAEFERFFSPPPFPDPTRYAPAVLPPDKKTDTIERPSYRDESYDKFARENMQFKERFFRSLAEIINNIPNEEKQGYLTDDDFIWFRLWSEYLLSPAFQTNSTYEMYQVPNHPMVRQFLVFVEDELRDTIYDQLYCSRYRGDIDTRLHSIEPTRNTIHPESEPEDVYGDRARIRQNYTQEFLDFIDYYYRPYTLRPTKVADAVDTLKAVLLQQDQDPENVEAGPVAGEDGGDGDDADNEPALPPKKKQRVVALKQVKVPPSPDMGTASGLRSARMPSPLRSPARSPIPSLILSPLRMRGPRLTTRPAWQWLAVDPNEPTVESLPDMGTASGLGSFPEYPPNRPAYSLAHSPRPSPPRGPLESGHDFTRLTIPNLLGGIDVMPIAGAGSSSQLGYVPVGSSRIPSPEFPRHSPSRSFGNSPARSPRPSPPRDPLESGHDFTRLTIPNLSGGIEVMPIAGAGSSSQLGYVPVGSSRIPSPEFPRRSPVRSHSPSPIRSPPLVGIAPARRSAESPGDLGENNCDDVSEPPPKKKRRVVDPSEATGESGLGSARMPSPRRSPARSPRPSPPRGPLESGHESTRLTIPNLSGGIDVIPIAGAGSSTEVGYIPVGSSRIPSPDHTARSPGQFLVRGPLPSQLSSPIQSPPLVGQQAIVDLGPEEVQQYFGVEGIVSDIREEVGPEGFNPAENVQLSPTLQQYLPSGNTTPVASPAASPGHDLSPDPALSPGENQLLDEVMAEMNDHSDEEDIIDLRALFDEKDDQQQGQ